MSEHEICSKTLRFSSFLRDETGVYVKDVGKDDNVDVTYTIFNNGERAYETIMYAEYDDSLVELPQLIKGVLKNLPVLFFPFEKLNLKIFSAF